MRKKIKNLECACRTRTVDRNFEFSGAGRTTNGLESGEKEWFCYFMNSKGLLILRATKASRATSGATETTNVVWCT